MPSRAVAYRVNHGRTTTARAALEHAGAGTTIGHTGRHTMSAATTMPGHGFPPPRLTGAQLDALEESVERGMAALAGPVRARHAAPAAPALPEAGAGWPRRALRAVVRVWREAVTREAGLDAERDEVRRRLLSDQPRLW